MKPPSYITHQNREFYCVRKYRDHPFTHHGRERCSLMMAGYQSELSRSMPRRDMLKVYRWLIENTRRDAFVHYTIEMNREIYGPSACYIMLAEVVEKRSEYSHWKAFLANPARVLVEFEDVEEAMLFRLKWA